MSARSPRSWRGRLHGSAGFVAGGLAVAVLGGGALAVAAIPDSSTGVFTACVKKTSGDLRMIDAQAGATCTSRERTLTWSTGWTYRGTWSGSTAYAAGDAVVADGASYVARTASTGQPPAATPTAWGLLAQQGARGPEGPAGAPGEPGADGEPGPQGPAGPSGVLSVKSFSGPVNGISATTNGYVFAGPSTIVTISVAGERVTGSYSAVLGHSGSSPVTVAQGMCWQPAGGGALSNFVNLNYLDTAINPGAKNNVVSASASVTLPTGSYRVGGCVDNPSTQSIDRTDYVNGWVMLTRD